MNNSYARLIRSMATEFWMNTVLKLMGDISCGRAQKKIWPNPIKDGIDISNRIVRHLYRSKNGIPVRDNEFVAAIEKENPGSQRILLHPLWDILLHPEASSEYLLQIMDRLDPTIKQKLFKVDPITKLSVRKTKNKYQYIFYIAMRNDLDALACLLMLIRENELNEKVGEYLCCKRQVVHLVRRLSLFRPFCSIASKLYDVIYRFFIEKNNPLTFPSLGPFMETFKHKFDIPFKVSLYEYKDMASGILWNAEQRKIISSDESEQLTFLFWIDNYINKIDLDNTLKSLPTDFDPQKPMELFPEPLKDLMKRFKGDSRRYLPTKPFPF